ncbi:MAG: hypothetical protein DRO96_01320 [Candidatus Aenigmatarchaeota archaeon]|nr:MAG: hypothetical protein B6U68_02500 [Candidatus Aenigmarchaeota archaeon ex4484_14]RLI97160.1 MAG: hypothetical protein DRO96_01320 [Candidatus Aenigmarchaeota archaeon]
MRRKKKTVGLIERVEVIGKKVVSANAKFDTGASGNSIDTTLAAKAQLGPIVSVVKIKQANLKEPKRRPVVDVTFRIKGKKYKTRANIEDRSHMSYPVLIGRELIRNNFVVDVAKTGRRKKAKKC